MIHFKIYQMHKESSRFAAYCDRAGYERQIVPPSSIKYKYPIALQTPLRKYPKCVINVVEGDTLEVTRSLQRSGLKPLTLNMASCHTPGGGWDRGMGAQEESLFYRSVYYQTLKKHFYPLSDDVAVYSPNVTVFRDSNLTNLSPDQCWTADFVAVAAIRSPPIINERLPKELAELTERKLELIFQIAIKHNHDSLVLSAFGCGAYANPPEFIMGCFNRLINKYKESFKQITFGIIGRDETRSRYFGDVGLDNLAVFKKGIIQD